MALNDTPRGDRLQIGIFGRRNAGKSSLINAITGQDLAIVSPTPGTTTDPILKSMELHPVGPVVFVDTAGFDDEGDLGRQRRDRTKEYVDRVDLGVIVIDGTETGPTDGTDLSVTNGTDGDRSEANEETTGQGYLEEEARWIKKLREKNCPVILVLNKCDALKDSEKKRALQRIEKLQGSLEPDATEQKLPLYMISATEEDGLEELREGMVEALQKHERNDGVPAAEVKKDSLVLLVMPQDEQAPKGRLILPQVQTIRALLDKNCTVVSTTADGYRRALTELSRAPEIIITDSQCFEQVAKDKPRESRLTSFSILMAEAKGDIDVFVDGAKAIDDLARDNMQRTGSAGGSDQNKRIRILIAEACTHVPQNEDIGTVKIPRILRNMLGESVEIINVRGNDFPGSEELKQYDLIIHCGACMFNRRHVMNRIYRAQEAGVPITNYGVFLAKASGILEEIMADKQQC